MKDQFPPESTATDPMITPSSSTATRLFCVASPLMVGVATVLNVPSGLVLRMLLAVRLALNTCAVVADAGAAAMITK